MHGNEGSLGQPDRLAKVERPLPLRARVSQPEQILNTAIREPDDNLHGSAWLHLARRDASSGDGSRQSRIAANGDPARSGNSLPNLRSGDWRQIDIIALRRAALDPQH